MEQLLPWVERELKQFRRLGTELALKYPRVAGRLGEHAGQAGAVRTGGAGDRAAHSPDGAPHGLPCDPHVDRLVQASAVLHARIAHSMDRASPLLDEALLESLFPGLLRPFPACAVFRLAADASCGSVVHAAGMDGRDYRFRLTAPASGCSLQVVSLNWRPYAGPAGEHLLSLSLAGTEMASVDASAVGAGAGRRSGCRDGNERPARLRLYVDAEPVLRAALQDALLMLARAAWVSVGDGTPKALPAVPVGAAGFDETGDHAWQVLREYQCFAERFNFLELDLAHLLRHVQPGPEQLTLHVAVPVRADSDLARTLSRVEAGNLLTGCAPAINLFPAAAAPVDVSGRASEYGLAPADPAHVIWSVDSAHLLRGRVLEVLRPPRAMRYGDSPVGTWAARRALPEEAGPPMRIAFPSAARTAGPEVTASVALTCCDRVVPGGFVDVQPQAALVGAVSRLREVDGGRALRWRLLAMLALDVRPPDLESLGLALSLQDLAASDSAQKLQSALVDVRIMPAALRVRHKHGDALIDGTQIRVTMDERALVGASVAVFAQVIDQYLSHSVHLNSFMQLVAISAESGEELMRCRPRNGNLML